jgi:hypothetical protein
MASSSGARGEDLREPDTPLKPDTSGENTTGCELDSADKGSWTAETPDDLVDDVPLMNILPNSSHRDGSLYSGTERWKRRYGIADRTESK